LLECILSNPPFEVIGAWLLVSGAAGFSAMGIDKARAVHGEWRVSERTLLATAMVGGAFGVVLGSVLFHHKTSKLSFLAAPYAMVVVWLVALQRIGFLGCVFSGIP
jgi:uncharacterized membrane protein YsdA (DUF1294 family)